ncbi:MAG: RNA polymerase sigma factor [Phycisphaera sp.]|nr:MAG: RNA polymerase sigma factor [Phycisphaera sp.]
MKRGVGQVAHEMLVLSAQAGDDHSLARLVRVWQKPLLRHALRLMPDESSASDAVQEAWIAIGRSLRGLDDPARFRSWALRIVTNKCADIARTESRRRKVDRARSPTGGESRDSSSSRTDELRRAMGEMDTERRAMLALHYVDGLGVAELAEVFVVPTGTVKSRLYHARKELRERIERMES